MNQYQNVNEYHDNIGKLFLSTNNIPSATETQTRRSMMQKETKLNPKSAKDQMHRSFMPGNS